MALTILSNKGEEQEAIMEARQEWLIDVLLAFSVPEEAFDLEDDEIRQYMQTAGIEVWYHHDGSVSVERNGKLVAEWKSPEFTLIKEGKELYYEIHVQEWALPFQMQDKE